MSKFVWTDLAGIRRAKCVFRGSSASLPKATLCLPSYADRVISGSPVPFIGEFELRADNDGFLENTVYLVDILEEDGESPSRLCPRNLLKRALSLFEKATALTLRIGFEIEFLLLTKDKKPVDNQPYCTSRSLIDHQPLLIAIAEKLEQNGIEVLAFHGESAPGQFEIALKDTNALDSVEQFTIAKEIIIEVVQSNNRLVSFMPKPDATQAGNACHAHISFLDKMNGNAFGSSEHKYGLSEAGESFMAGVLGHLPALLALCVSSPNSFDRIQPSAWVGCTKTWGIQNRECPIRLVRKQKKPACNFECKFIDGSSNPYISIASIIFAGLDGIANKLSLPLPQTEIPVPTQSTNLPSTLEEAVQFLRKDEVLQQSLGETLLQTIILIRLDEHEFFKHMSIADRREILLERY